MQFASYGQFVLVTCNVSIKELQLCFISNFLCFYCHDRNSDCIFVYFSVCLSVSSLISQLLCSYGSWFLLNLYLLFIYFFVYNIRNNEACNKHAAIHSFLLLTFFHLLLPGIISKFCVFKNVEFHVGTACVNCKLTRYNCACNFSSP